MKYKITKKNDDSKSIATILCEMFKKDDAEKQTEERLLVAFRQMDKRSKEEFLHFADSLLAIQSKYYAAERATMTED